MTKYNTPLDGDHQCNTIKNFDIKCADKEHREYYNEVIYQFINRLKRCKSINTNYYKLINIKNEIYLEYKNDKKIYITEFDELNDEKIGKVERNRIAKEFIQNINLQDIINIKNKCLKNEEFYNNLIQYNKSYMDKLHKQYLYTIQKHFYKKYKNKLEIEYSRHECSSEFKVNANGNYKHQFSVKFQEGKYIIKNTHGYGDIFQYNNKNKLMLAVNARLQKLEEKIKQDIELELEEARQQQIKQNEEFKLYQITKKLYALTTQHLILKKKNSYMCFNYSVRYSLSPKTRGRIYNLKNDTLQKYIQKGYTEFYVGGDDANWETLETAVFNPIDKALELA